MMMMIVFILKVHPNFQGSFPRVLSAHRILDFMNGDDIISAFMEFDMKDDAVFRKIAVYII